MGKPSKALMILALVALAGCAATRSGGDLFKDPAMDFGSIQTVAVMPFQNLSREQVAAERVRDVFMTRLMATGGIYVLPPGEVARGIGIVGIQNPTAPSPEEMKKLAGIIKVNGVITGVVDEYGELRSGSASANMISVSMKLVELQLGKVVWSAQATKGGVGITDRLFGGGGKPMNDITVQAVDELIDKLYQ